MVAGFTDQPVGGKPAAAERAPRLGTIDPAYASGRPKIVFDGEVAASGKRYAYLASYTPVAGHRVLLIPVGTTSYVVLGRVL